MIYGIGNVKGKAIGGIPVIEITQSQMLSENTAQLTQEQYKIIQDNSFICVGLPTGQTLGFSRIKYQGEYRLVMCYGSPNEITYYTCDINSTTLVATLTSGDFQKEEVIANPTLAGTEADLGSIQIGETKYKIGGGKQLYLHMIRMQNSVNKAFVITLQIINDNNTPFTYYTLNQWLKTNGFIYKDEHNVITNVPYNANGNWNYAPDWYHVYGIRYNTYSQTIYFVGTNGATNQSGEVSNGNLDVVDSILTL